MRILLIGGTRFLGPFVVRRLVAAGHEVAVFHRGRTHAALPGAVEHISGDRVIGPVAVPRQVTELCQPMWDIGGVVAKTDGGWRFVEVWNVSP